MRERKSDVSTVKVHYIWTPHFQLGNKESLFVISQAIAIGVAGYPLFWLLGGPFFSRADDRRLFSALCGVGLFIVILFVIIFRRHERHAKRPAFRQGRLARLLSYKSASARYPHRAVEQFFRKFERKPRAMREMLCQLPPRHLVVMNAPNRSLHSRHEASDLRFEPINLLDAAHLSELESYETVATGSGNYQGNRAHYEVDMSSRAVKRNKHRRHAILAAVWFGLILFLPALFALRRGDLRLGLTSIGCCALLASAFWLLPLWLEVRAWLVPGAIIVRRVRLWPRRETTFLLTRDSHSLILDARDNAIRGLRNGKTVYIRFAERCFRAIVGGWISTASTPTLDEIRSFLGQPRDSK